MGKPIGEDRITAVMDALYKALVRYDYEDRNVRELRSSMGGRGPRIKRGTKRSALVRYLATEALAALDDETWTAQAPESPEPGATLARTREPVPTLSSETVPDEGVAE